MARKSSTEDIKQVESNDSPTSAETTGHKQPDTESGENRVEKGENEESESLESVGVDDSTNMTFTFPSSEVYANATREVVQALRMIREIVGQVSELTFEEERIVQTFSVSLFKLMKPLAKVIPVEPSILPRAWGDIEKANIIPQGKILIQHEDGGMESKDLGEERNRDVLVEVVKDTMPKFETLVARRKAKIEERMSFLASITKELQNIAEALNSSFQ